jgi:hypothetical protein
MLDGVEEDAQGMNPNAIVDALVTAVPALALGAAAGWAHFRMLRLAVECFVAGRGWRRAVVLSLGRFCAAGLMFWTAAQFGALPLLAAFLGFLVARRLAVAAAKEAA